MSNEKTFNEAEIKAEIIAAVHKELAEFKKSNPKEYKRNKEGIKLLESITSDNIELYAPKEVERITDIEFNAHRYYHFVYSSGSTSRVYKENPKKLTAKLLGVNSIYMINNVNKVYEKCVHWYKFGCDDPNFNNCIDNYSLLTELKNTFESIYNEVNATALFNDPQKTDNIVFSDWCVLESEIITDFPVFAIILNFKKGYSWYKWQIGTFDKKEMKTKISDLSHTLRWSRIYSNTSDPFEYHLKIKRGFFEIVFEKIKDMFS